MGRRLGGLFAMAWLLLLGFSFYSLLSSGHGWLYRAGGLAGGLTFCAVYAWTWLRPLRWRQAPQPAVSVIALTALALALSLADAGTWGYTFIYCTVVAGAVLSWRVGLPLAAAYALTVGALALGVGTGRGFALGAVIEIFLTGLGMIGVFRLVAANVELRQAREEIARLAVSEERLRFARDLHDLLGHSLSVVVLKSELASRLAARDPERAAAEMADVEKVARQALNDVREAVAGYRRVSLAQELEGVQQVLKSAGIRPRVERTAGPLPAEVEDVMAWAVREGVTNVLRHSGARTCEVVVSRQDGLACLEIRDDGAGPALPPVEGTGLRGLRERVEAHGGSLQLGPRAGQGFRLQVSLPGG